MLFSSTVLISSPGVLSIGYIGQGCTNSGRLRFVRLCLIFVDPLYGTHFTSQFLRLEFLDGP